MSHSICIFKHHGVDFTYNDKIKIYKALQYLFLLKYRDPHSLLTNKNERFIKVSEKLKCLRAFTQLHPNGNGKSVLAKWNIRTALKK